MILILNRQSSLPLYVQLEIELRQRIDNEEWAINTCIPSESVLSRTYGISRMTVRSVLERLTEEGLLYRVPGKGTFVAEPKLQRQPSNRSGMLDQFNQMGFHAEGEVLSASEIIPSRRIAGLLNLAENESTAIVCCLSRVGQVPISYHTSYLPVSIFPDVTIRCTEYHQLIDIIQKEYRYPIFHYTETLQVKSASPEESALLDVKPNAPLLMLDTVYFSKTNAPLGYSRAILRGDKVNLKFDYDSL